NTFRYASKKDWDAIKRDVKPIYTAAAARDAMPDKREARYPAATSPTSRPRSSACT
ncbi:transposase, partial [Bifidobacterium bifidum LMG 13195]